MADPADTGDVGQQTISQAGLDPFSKEITRIEGRRQSMLDTSQGLATQRAATYGNMENLTAGKMAESQPVRDKMAAAVQSPPSAQVSLERAPAFERPMMDPKQAQESFGILMAASLLVGAAARAPFYGAMNALTGAMTGWQNKDEQMFKDATVEFDKNLAAIKERNEAKRTEVNAALTDYSNNLAGMKAQLELIAQKYNDPIALMTLRTKSLGESQKLIDANLEKENQAVERLLRDQANLQSAKARIEEAGSRRAEIESRERERLDLAREREDRIRTDAAARGDRGRFTDEQKLRKEYQAAAKGMVGDLDQVNRILTIADKGGAFADVQLRQAISQFQKGARGTNAMIASMTNFGTLDERVAGSLNRFFAGEYTPEQRTDIVNLFGTLRDQVLQPGLDETKAKYKYLATQNRLKPEQVVVDEGALGGAGGGGAPKPRLDLPAVTVTPR